MATTKKDKEVEHVADVQETELRGMVFGILGKTPLICNRMGEKARQTLLLGGERVNAAARAARLKHDPYEEFRASPYILEDASSPTYIAMMASAFRKAIATAALDLPGQKKAQVARLVYVEAEQNLIPIYGIPELFMSITRSSDINHTPDVRTRALLRHWGALLTISYVYPLIKPQSVWNLLKTAGMTVGIGDWRTEKGSGTYGQFEVVDVDTPQLQEIITQCRRATQMQAMTSPQPYDEETKRLLSWFDTEVTRRGFQQGISDLAPVGAGIDTTGMNGDESEEE